MTNWFDRIKKYYDAGLWTAKMVGNAVVKGKIVDGSKKKIVGRTSALSCWRTIFVS